jgi:hypothetical protein
MKIKKRELFMNDDCVQDSVKENEERPNGPAKLSDQEIVFRGNRVASQNIHSVPREQTAILTTSNKQYAILYKCNVRFNNSSVYSNMHNCSYPQH